MVNSRMIGHQFPHLETFRVRLHTDDGPNRPKMGSSRAQHRTILLGIIALYLLHALWLSSTEGFRLVDDAYISLTYVRNLLQGHGLVFNPGERVEGYSNFLWLLLVSPLSALGLDPIRATQLLGLSFGCLTLHASWHLTQRLTGSSWLGLATAFLLASDGSFARWAIDGLETLLFTFLITTALRLEITEKQGLRRYWRPSWTGLTLGFAALTRPEGSLFFGFFVLFRVTAGLRATLGMSTQPGPTGRVLEDRVPPIGERVFWQEISSLILCFAIVVIPHLLFRHAYYGEWVPNTAYTKFHPGLVSLVRGTEYTVRFLGQHLGVVLLTIVAGWQAYRTRTERTASSPFRSTVLLCLLYTSYVIFIGGDWMNRGRFFMPIAPLLAMMCVEQVGRAFGGGTLERGYPFRFRAGALVCTMAITGWLGTSLLGEYPKMLEANIEHLGREGVIRWLNQHAPPGATLLTEEIGAIPYYTGLKTFDVYGLIDPYVARNGLFEPDAPAGHQVADLGYSLSLKPDFLVMAGFKDAYHRNTAPGAHAVRYPSLREYELLPLQLIGQRYEIYRRRDSSRTGVPSRHRDGSRSQRWQPTSR